MATANTPYRREPPVVDARLKKAADDARTKARRLPNGPRRDALLREASLNETRAHLEGWATSSGLQSPK
ncbi:hypothetical protein JQ604_28300 [Bradyrhizobium jicamae]|uniref:hypothetical protein n=1 Tax=Bradyrhizobium jicamae TaxID=280332 RepID=UPI001BABC289|nr:hypothetical protein [Bradyrhizobium jicamae]MBR0756094.1 hypothetical protein [Bradyrhizobium jicamae]